MLAYHMSRSAQIDFRVAKAAVADVADVDVAVAVDAAVDAGSREERRTVAQVGLGVVLLWVSHQSYVGNVESKAIGHLNVSRNVGIIPTYNSLANAHLQEEMEQGQGAGPFVKAVC